MFVCLPDSKFKSLSALMFTSFSDLIDMESAPHNSILPFSDISTQPVPLLLITYTVLLVSSSSIWAPPTVLNLMCFWLKSSITKWCPPGVRKPNTPLGDSLLAELSVSPLILSFSKPCVVRLANIGSCLDLRTLSIGFVPSTFS